MDDLAELREILASEPDAADPEPDQEAAAAPLDGAPVEEPSLDATPPEDLSAEERIDLLARAEMAAEIGEDPEAPDEDEEDDDAEGEEGDAEGTDEDFEALLAEGRAARAARAEQEQLAPYLAVYQTAEQRIAEGKAHYEQERARIYAAVQADARRSVDPDAYLDTHLLPALNGVSAAEEAWIGQIGQDARNQVQAIRERQSRPAWAAHLVATRRLPQAAIARILQTTDDPRAMPAVADLLVEARNALAAERRKATQANRSAAARQIASNQVHPSGTGSAPNGKLPEIQGDRDELVAILKMK